MSEYFYGSWFVIPGLSQEFMGEVNRINVACVNIGNGFFMIDTGVPGSLKDVENGLKKINKRLDQLKGIIITHHHFDHIGNLNKIHMLHPQIPVYSGDSEIPYIKGQQHLKGGKIDFVDLKTLFPGLSHSLLERQEQESVPDYFVGDIKSSNELPPEASSRIKIIDTPGHTVGHISVYDPLDRVLVCGDAMMYWKGKLRGPVRSFSWNYEIAVKTSRTLTDLPIKVLIGYHGEPFLGQPMEFL